jgi:hypothetical protein
MKNTFKLAILIFLSSIVSCINKPIDEESRIINQIMLKYCQSDSAIFLNKMQGIFSYKKKGADSVLLFYSKIGFGVYTFNQCTYVDSFSIPDIETVPEIFETNEFWNNSGFEDLKIVDLNFLKDYLIKDSLKNNYNLDWDKLGKKGINALYTTSQPMLSPRMNYGMIGIQKYTPSSLQLRIVSFNSIDSVAVVNENIFNFIVLGYILKFKNDYLYSFEPDGLVLK